MLTTMLDMSVPTGNLSEKKKENYIEDKTGCKDLVLCHPLKQLIVYFLVVGGSN